MYSIYLLLHITNLPILAEDFVLLSFVNQLVILILMIWMMYNAFSINSNQYAIIYLYSYASIII